MSDPFFTQTHCTRCPNELTTRQMSWFTDDTLCSDCVNKERAIRKQLPKYGQDFEGCGYIPDVSLLT